MVGCFTLAFSWVVVRPKAWWRPLNHVIIYGGCLRLLLQAWCTGLGCVDSTSLGSIFTGTRVQESLRYSALFPIGIGSYTHYALGLSRRYVSPAWKDLPRMA